MVAVGEVAVKLPAHFSGQPLGQHRCTACVLCCEGCSIKCGERNRALWIIENARMYCDWELLTCIVTGKL